MTICGFSTKSQPELLLVSSNKPALTLPTMWMVSSIFFSPFDLTPPGHIEGRRGRNRSAKDAMMVISDQTNPSQSGEPNHTHRSNIGSQGVQPQLIHRSNTGPVRGSTPTPTVNPQAGLRQDQLQHLQPSQARHREIGPQRFGRRAPGRQGIKCRPKTEPSDVFICKMSVFAPTT